MDSGLNSVVLANNEETILLPINEPTYGTKDADLSRAEQGSAVESLSIPGLYG